MNSRTIFSIRYINLYLILSFMKKRLFTLFIILSSFCFANKIFAQDAITRTASNDAATAYLRNTVITIGNKNFDYRILKHYSEQELNNMSELKRNQVYFINTQSYHVLDLANCPTLKESDIDVSKLEVFRKENTKTTVLYGNDCKVSVELISQSEMQELMEVLNNTTK